MRGNIIICGAPRAGTTSLFRYLAAHPDVAPSRVKELNYFLGCGQSYEDLWKENPDPNDYYACFKSDVSAWTLEASPAYMHPRYSELVAGRMQSLLPEIRLIMVLRNPVDRLVSQYKGHRERAGLYPDDFSFDDFTEMLLHGRNPIDFGVSEAMAAMISEGLEVGAYAKSIRTYLQYFPATRIQPVFTDELASQPDIVMKNLCTWLGISPAPYDGFSFSVENKMINSRSKKLYRAALQANRALEPVLNRLPRVRVLLRSLHHSLNAAPPAGEISPEVREALNGYYEPHNLDLYKLLHLYWPEVKAPHWLVESSNHEHI